jgi:two-component system nitrate/nitrite response regulator NarL
MLGFIGGLNIMNDLPFLIVGGSGLFRRGLCCFLEGSSYRLVGEYDDTKSCIADHQEEGAAEIVIYVSSGNPASSADAVDALVTSLDAKVLVLSSDLSVDELGACLRVGAGGYLLSDISSEALNHSLRLISLGEIIFPSQLAASWASGQLRSKGRTDKCDSLRNPLTPREAEILACLTEGASNKLIARQFGITEPTVKIHVKALIRKIGVQNRTQAALWAVQSGFGTGSLDMAA